MSLVSVNDGYGTRVGPKVFADVPTASEVQNAKRGRATFLLITLFLFGLVVAAGLVIGYLLSQDYPAQSRPGEVKEQIQAFEDADKIQIAQIAEYERERRLYANLMGAEADADQMLARVNVLLGEKENARSRTIRYNAELWAAHRRLRDRDWVNAQVASIGEDRTRVAQLITVLEALSARAPAGSGTTADDLLPTCNPATQLCGRAP